MTTSTLALVTGSFSIPNGKTIGIDFCSPEAKDWATYVGPGLIFQLFNPPIFSLSSTGNFKLSSINQSAISSGSTFSTVNWKLTSFSGKELSFETVNVRYETWTGSISPSSVVTETLAEKATTPPKIVIKTDTPTIMDQTRREKEGMSILALLASRSNIDRLCRDDPRFRLFFLRRFLLLMMLMITNQKRA